MKKNQLIFGGLGVLLLGALAFPVPYKIYGDCELAPQFNHVLRATKSGKLVSFHKNSGERIRPGELVARLENLKVVAERNIASYQLEKETIRMREKMDPASVQGYVSEKLNYEQKERHYKALNVAYETQFKELAILSCSDQIKKLNTYLNEGDEICRVQGVERLLTVIDVSEQEVRMLEEGQEVKFRLFSAPLTTYGGRVSKIRPTTTADPKNPKHKMYRVEMNIENPGELRPGMKGKAKILGTNVPVIKYAGIQLASALRLDLFF